MFECQVCGKILKNKKNIKQHNKTQVHQLALQGIPKKATTAAERMRKHRQRLRDELGDEKYKERMKEEKRKQKCDPETTYNDSISRLYDLLICAMGPRN